MGIELSFFITGIVFALIIATILRWKGAVKTQVTETIDNNQKVIEASKALAQSVELERKIREYQRKAQEYEALKKKYNITNINDIRNKRNGPTGPNKPPTMPGA